MALSIRTADEPTIRLLDRAVLAWLALWLIVGIWSGITLWQLSDVGDTVSKSGRAIGSAGEALTGLSSIPVIGERPGELGRQATATGADIDARGQDVKARMRQLSLLLGFAITLIPTTPVAGLYVPLRQARRRETADLRRALDDHADDELDTWLAERARVNLPYSTLRAASTDALGSRTRGLADAELALLGLRRPRARSID